MQHNSKQRPPDSSFRWPCSAPFLLLVLCCLGCDAWNHDEFKINIDATRVSSDRAALHETLSSLATKWKLDNSAPRQSYSDSFCDFSNLNGEVHLSGRQTPSDFLVDLEAFSPGSNGLFAWRYGHFVDDIQQTLRGEFGDRVVKAER